MSFDKSIYLCNPNPCQDIKHQHHHSRSGKFQIPQPNQSLFPPSRGKHSSSPLCSTRTQWFSRFIHAFVCIGKSFLFYWWVVFQQNIPIEYSYIVWIFIQCNSIGTPQFCLFILLLMGTKLFPVFVYCE